MAKRPPHTPLPYKRGVGMEILGQNEPGMYNMAFPVVAECPGADSGPGHDLRIVNRDYLIRASNNHYPLIQALEDARRFIMDAPMAGSHYLKTTLDEIDKALKEAKS